MALKDKLRSRLGREPTDADFANYYAAKVAKSTNNTPTGGSVTLTLQKAEMQSGKVVALQGQFCSRLMKLELDSKGQPQLSVVQIREKAKKSFGGGAPLFSFRSTQPMLRTATASNVSLNPSTQPMLCRSVLAAVYRHI